MTQCEGCGLETSEPGLLKDRRKSFSKRHVKLCPACQVDSLKYAQRTNWSIFGVVLLLGLLLAIARGDSGIFFMFSGLIAAIAVFSVVSVTLHEVGHAVVAKAAGWQLCAVFLGFGRLLWQGRCGHVLVQFRFIQMGGRVICVPRRDGPFLPVQAFLIFAAGPAVNALAAWAGWMLYSPGQGRVFDGVPLSLLAELWIFMNLFNAVTNLLPYKTSIAGGSLGSDGYQMLQALFKPGVLREHYLYGRGVAQYSTLRQLGELESARLQVVKHLQSYPYDILGLQLMSAAECELGNYAECAQYAAQGLARLAQGAELHPAATAGQPEAMRKMVEGAFQCNLAYAMLRGRTGDRGEALHLARNAYEKLPWFAAVQHTYGYALALNGNVAEGIKYLKLNPAKLRDEPEHSRRERRAIIAEVEAL